MKKLLLSLFASIVVISFSIPALAVSHVYHFQQIGVSVTSPEGWATFTRTTDSSDPWVSKLGITDFEALRNHYFSSNIYYNSIIPTGECEIVLTTMNMNGMIDNLNDYADDQLSSILTVLNQVSEASGTSRVYSEEFTVYNHSQAKFMIINFTTTTTNMKSRQYYTIINGYTYNFVLNSFTGQITDEMISIQDKLVETIVFYEPNGTAPAIDLYTPEPAQTSTAVTEPPPQTSTALTEDDSSEIIDEDSSIADDDEDEDDNDDEDDDDDDDKSFSDFYEDNKTIITLGLCGILILTAIIILTGIVKKNKRKT